MQRRGSGRGAAATVSLQLISVICITQTQTLSRPEAPPTLSPPAACRLMSGQDGDGAGAPADGSLPAICQQTRLALSTWRHLLTNASTPSTNMTPSKRARTEGAADVGQGCAESRTPQQQQQL